jgi:predicted dehydrogenase
MQKLRVGVIGVGYLGKFHAEKYARMPDVDLVGVVDTDDRQAAQVAESTATEAYSDYRDLFGKVDAVSIVVPTPLHFAVSRDFLANDVDLLIEKPITTTLADAEELIRLSEDRGLIVQVGHLERFNPAVTALRNVLKKPLFIEAHRLSMYQERCTDVSVVLDLMIHDIDIILNCVGSTVTRILAAGIPVISGLVDIANARLEFANGCVANVTASRIATRQERKIRFFQRDAYIAVDFANRAITTVRQDATANAGPIPGMQIETRDFAKADALDDELKAFVGAVRRREAPEVTAQMGYEALKIALSIMEQIQSTSRSFLDS